MQKDTDLFIIISCLMLFQISIRALTYIVPHLEFVKRSVPMKLDVCVTKPALPIKIQCVPVTEQHTTANVFMSWATAGDWTTILFITQGAVRVSERLHSKPIIQRKLRNCDAGYKRLIRKTFLQVLRYLTKYSAQIYGAQYGAAKLV